MGKFAQAVGVGRAEQAYTRGAGKIARRNRVVANGLRETEEFRRINNLPRRDWTNVIDEEVVEEMTTLLKTPDGDMRLKPVQAAGLADFLLVGGLFAIIETGGGKELLSLLLPKMLPDLQPAVLIVPASLRVQVVERDLDRYGRHFNVHRYEEGVNVLTYNDLSSASKNEPDELLFKIQPRLIVLNEAQHVRNLDTGRGRRLRHYMNERPETHLAVLSGSISKTSLKDYWHLLVWSLKEDIAPLPARWPELQDWADALDEDPALDQSWKRVLPGVLLDWATPGERAAAEAGPDQRLHAARRAYKRRLHTSFGVVASGDDDDLGVPFVVRERPSDPPKVVLEAVNRLRTLWETPNGETFVMAADLYRHIRTAFCGFWYRWDPPAPPEWLEARRAWNAYVRDVLRHNRRKLYTPLQVWNECRDVDAGKYRRPIVTHEVLEIWRRWRDLRHTFRPNPVAEWISDYLVDDVLRWAEDDEQGLVWVDHNAFGQRLDEKGLPYFGAGKTAARSVAGHDGPLALSLSAHAEGRDGLQHRHSRMLVSSMFGNGLRWEQAVGRLVRLGQEAVEVTCDVYLPSEEMRELWRRARKEARAREDTTHGRQRFNSAHVLFDEE